MSEFERPIEATRSRVILIGAQLATALAVFLWLSVFLHLVLVVPGKARLFADFRLRVPVLTEVVIDVSRWMVNYWYVVLFAGAVLAGVAMFLSWVLAAGLRSPLATILWCLILILTPVILHGVIWYSWDSPMQRLIQGLAK